MTPLSYEMHILLWASALGIFQIALAAFAPIGQEGYLKWNMGPRDQAFELKTIPARLSRASKNFQETYPFVAVAILALALSHTSTELSLWSARIYLVARILYIPLYALGLPLRSMTWVVSLGAIIGLYTALFI